MNEDNSIRRCSGPGGSSPWHQPSQLMSCLCFVFVFLLFPGGFAAKRDAIPQMVTSTGMDAFGHARSPGFSPRALCLQYQ